MNATLAINLLLALIDRAAAIGALLSKAKAEGRDVSDAELDSLADADDAERERGRVARDNARRG